MGPEQVLMMLRWPWGLETVAQAMEIGTGHGGPRKLRETEESGYE